MPLWLAVVLLLLALGGIALSRRYLRHDRSARVLCTVVCALAVLAAWRMRRRELPSAIPAAQ